MQTKVVMGVEEIDRTVQSTFHDIYLFHWYSNIVAKLCPMKFRFGAIVDQVECER